jgi:hypothetical protein
MVVFMRSNDRVSVYTRSNDRVGVFMRSNDQGSWERLYAK